MKKYVVSIVALVFAAALATAQVPEGYQLVDSLIYIPVSAVDTTISGSDIFSELPGNVRVNQSYQLRETMHSQVLKNESRQFNGWRIRIYFDNKQDSRVESEAMVNRFKAKYPGYAAYRSYANPFFKVTVGDFRTKADAVAALNRISRDFPTAFVVREKFKYPALEENSFIADTIQYLKPIPVVSVIE